MAEDTLKVEISFPVKVELTQDDMRQFDAITGEICDRYKAAHPGRVMWPAGVGSKVLYMPMTRDEELAGKHMEFDDAVFAIDCAEREDFDCLCAKCGIEQGEHSHCIIDGSAGDCEFEPAKGPPEVTRERGLVPMHVYLAAVRGRQDMRAALREARAKVKELEGLLSGKPAEAVAN